MLVPQAKHTTVFRTLRCCLGARHDRMSSCRSKSAVGSAPRGLRSPAELLELVGPGGWQLLAKCGSADYG